MEKQLGLPMKCKFFTVFSAAILFTIAAVFANPIYVSKTGNDANDGLSWETAKSDLQSVVQSLNPSTVVTVMVGQGTWQMTNDHMTMNNRIHLKGSNPTCITNWQTCQINTNPITPVYEPLIRTGVAHTNGMENHWVPFVVPAVENRSDGDEVSKTIIVPAPYCRGIYVAGTGRQTTIDSITVQGAYVTNWPGFYGFGIYATTNTIITNCIVKNNSMPNYVDDNSYIKNQGAGVYRGRIFNSIITSNKISGRESYSAGCHNSYVKDSILSHNYVEHPNYGYGGGMCYGDIETSLVYSNRSDSYAGGLSQATASNCLILRNSAKAGGGAAYSDIFDSVIMANTASSNGTALFFSTGRKVTSGCVVDNLENGSNINMIGGRDKAHGGELFNSISTNLVHKGAFNIGRVSNCLFMSDVSYTSDIINYTAKGGVVDRCVFANNLRVCYLVTGGTNITVIRSRFNNNTDNWSGANGVIRANLFDSIIENCVFNNSLIDNHSMYANRVIIRNNTFYYYFKHSGLLWFRTSSLDPGSPLYSFCNSYIYNNTLIGDTLIGANLQIISRYYDADHSSKTNKVLIANNTICNNHLVNSTNALVFVSDEISNFTLANNIFFGNTNSVTGKSSPLVYVANPNPTIRIVNNFTNDPHFLTGTFIPQSILADFGGPRNLGETNDLSIIGSVDALGRPRVNARLGNIPDAGAIEYYPPQYRRERFRIMINRRSK